MDIMDRAPEVLIPDYGLGFRVQGLRYRVEG